MLTITLLCIGRLKSGSELELATRYLERARQTGRGLGLAVDVRELSESRARRPEDRKIEEAGEIRSALGDRRGSVVVFDERGLSVDSAGFAALIGEARDKAIPLTFVVGGPDGLDPTLRAEASHTVALGSMTWPHALARILAAEQIYRAMTMLSGHPYHRA